MKKRRQQLDVEVKLYDHLNRVVVSRIQTRVWEAVRELRYSPACARRISMVYSRMDRPE